MSDIPIPENRSGEILAQGISGATSNLADTILQLGQLHKQTKAFRTMAIDGLGMDPDTVDRMSLPELQGTMQGMALKSAQQERQANIQYMMEHGNYFRQRGQLEAADAARVQAGLDANKRAMADIAQETQLQPQPGFGVINTMMNGAVQPQLDRNRLLNIYAKEGALTPDMMMKLSGIDGENGSEIKFQEDPVTGRRFGTFGKSIMDSGIDPKMMPAGGVVQSILDEEGNEVGKGTINPKTGAIQILSHGPKTLPAGFSNALYGAGGEFSSGIKQQFDAAKANLAMPDADIAARLKSTKPADIAAFKARNKTALQNAQTNAQQLFDLHQSQGYGTPDVWNKLYSQFDLTPPATPKSTPASSRDDGSTGAAGGVVQRIKVVDPTGGMFTVPANQLDAALKQGYKQVQ